MSFGPSDLPTVDALAGTRANATQFDPLGLAALCGGLQLMPANAHALWRIGALAALVAGDAPPATTRQARVADVRSLLNSGDLASLATQQEDPFDDVLVEEVTFHEGSFRIGSGLTEDGVAILRNVVAAVLLSGILPKDAYVDLTRTAAAALHLSHAVLSAAGLERHVPPPPAQPGGAIVPGASTARRLAGLVTFDLDGLRRAAGTQDISCLDPLIAPQGGTPATTEQIVAGTPNRWPLLRDGDRVVLARPYSIALALRHHLVCAALHLVEPNVLAAAFGQAADRDALDALRHLGTRGEGHSARFRSAAKPWTEFASKIDTGLQLRCLVVGDGFAAVDPDDPYAMWDGNETLMSAHNDLERQAAASTDEILGLVVATPAGGAAMLGTPYTQAENLHVKVLGLTDLETVCFHEADDILAFWKWLRAADAITGRVMSFSARDMYGVYREQERTHAPQVGATLVQIAPGSGTKVRLEYKAIRDLHGVKCPDGTVREIRRTGPNDAASRIYHPVDIGDRPLLLVGGLPLPVWTVGARGADRATWSLANSVAYWLGELAEPLGPLYERIGSRLPCAAIEVHVDNPEVWWGLRDDPGGGAVATRTRSGLTSVITFGLPVGRLLSDPGNDADRLIVHEIAAALDDLARAYGLPGADLATREAAVEAVAPPGPKKHLIALPGAGNEIAEPARGGRPRLVQQADSSYVREALARHLAAFGWRGEPVPHDCRDDVLKSAVGFLFDEVCARMDATAADGLLDALIDENERLIASTEYRQALLPARLATYPESASELREEVARDNQAAIVCRFLVEYVTARPPQGQIPWSLRRYDECLALGAELLDWAYLDDAVNAGLSAADLLIRDDGQLRLVELDRYEHGRAQFFTDHLEAGRTASASIFPMRFTDSEHTRHPTLVRLDAPMAAEAGLDVAGLVELLHAAAAMAREAEVEVMTLKRSEAVALLAETINQPVDLTEQAIAYLTLAPRAAFLTPPTGKTKEVLPSRFARRWSYVRRPFLLVGTGDDAALKWGRRHPLAALRVLLGQLLSGRYQHLAEGPLLRSELGAISSESGHAFEDRVAGVFRGHGLPARPQVKSIGNDSLRHTPDGDLGDIDVLVLDRDRKTLWVVECKDLAGAMTPGDIVDEMTEHFTDQQDTTVAQLRARITWLEERSTAALRELGCDEPAGRWRTRGLFVTGEPVIAPLISDVPFPIVPIAELPVWLQRASTSAPRRRRARKKR